MLFWNPLNREGYIKVLADGSEVELEINSGIENLSSEEFCALRPLVFNSSDMLQTEAALRDFG